MRVTVRLSLWLLFLTLTGVHAARHHKSSSTPYNVLGVSTDATADDIKKAYRKAALKHHPDKGGSSERFQEVSKAYETLSDPEKRKLYDQFGDAAFDPSQQAQPNYGSAFRQGGSSPFFSSFGGDSMPFSFGGDPASSMSGDPILDQLLRQMMGGGMFHGTTRPHPSARGKRFNRQSYERTIYCSLEELATGATKKLKVEFPGIGSKTYTVHLKPGWKTGTKITFPARGFPEIVFIVKEKKHPRFVRKGDDLIYRHKLSEGDSQLTIALLDGTRWSRSTRNQKHHRGGRITVPNLGMPIKGGPSRGDLIIELE